MDETLQLVQFTLDKAPECIFWVEASGRFIYVNEAACRNLGYLQKELLALSVFYVDPIRSPQTWHEHWQQVKESGTVQFETSHRRKDGSVMPVEMIVNYLSFNGREYLCGFARDITERKKAENELRASEELLRESELKYRSLVERINDWVWEVDPNCIYTYVSPRIEDLLGYTPEEVIGKACYDLMTPEEAARVRKIFSPIVEQQKAFSLLENTLLHKDGRSVVVETSGEPIFDDQGTFLGYRGIDRDVTERYLVVTQIKKAEELSTALNRVNSAISSTLDFNEIMQRTVIEAAQALGVESAAISMRRENVWETRYVYNLPEGVIGSQFTDEDAPYLAVFGAKGQPIALNDLENELIVPQVARRFGVKSVLLVPLVLRLEITGLLSFHVHSRNVEFDALQIDFAAKLATSVSLALANARLYESERAAAAREAESRAYAQHQFTLLQRALIPERPSPGPGYQAADMYVPAYEGQEIGGDFYEVFQTKAGQTGILIGDVAGKDIEAAALGAAARSTARAFAYEMSSASEALEHTNAVLCAQQAEPGPFITMFLALIDRSTGSLTYAAAGHPPPAIYRSDGSVEFLQLGQPPLAVTDRIHFEEVETHLDPGDKLVCYTDGISEARRRTEMFETDGVERVLRQHGCQPLDELVYKLVTAAEEWAQGSLTDDIAVLAIERER